MMSFDFFTLIFINCSNFCVIFAFFSCKIYLSLQISLHPFMKLKFLLYYAPPPHSQIRIFITGGRLANFFFVRFFSEESALPYVFFPCIYIYFITYNRNFEAILVLLPEWVSIHALRYTYFYQLSILLRSYWQKKFQ